MATCSSATFTPYGRLSGVHFGEESLSWQTNYRNFGDFTNFRADFQAFSEQQTSSQRGESRNIIICTNFRADFQSFSDQSIQSWRGERRNFVVCTIIRADFQSFSEQFSQISAEKMPLIPSFSRVFGQTIIHTNLVDPGNAHHLTNTSQGNHCTVGEP